MVALQQTDNYSLSRSCGGKTHWRWAQLPGTTIKSWTSDV